MTSNVLVAVAFSLAVLREGTAAISNAPPRFRYAPVELLVVDSSTQRPLVGAFVSTYCLGGTPYATNTYHTDTNGAVRAMFYEGGLAAVRVTMAGYQTSSVALFGTNRVVSLRRSKP